jgi:hypothetical protein
VKVVSERIGHADPAVTMQVYAHALEGDDATAAETTAEAIFGDRRPSTAPHGVRMVSRAQRTPPTRVGGVRRFLRILGASWV